MKKLTSFLLLVFCYTLNAQQAKEIKGRCTDEKGIPLASVNISVLDSTKSENIIDNIPTDSQGYFLCKNIMDGYILYFSRVGYQSERIEASSIKDSENLLVKLKESPIELSEVTVTAERLKSYGIKDELFLSSKDKEKGVNALDVIANMPQFKANTVSGKLTTQFGKSILIIMDGRRVSEHELMMVQPKDISKLVFYANPPSRYAHENVESVLEVRTKKTKDVNYSLYIDTKNSVTTGYGTNLINVSYKDSVNQITAAYFIDYRYLKGNLTNNMYKYGNSENKYDGQSGMYKGQYHIGQLVYQRNMNSGMFFSKLSYSGNPGEQYASQLFENKTEQNKITGINQQTLNSKYHSWDLELYYEKIFSDNRSLIFNVINKYTTSHSNNLLSRKVESLPSMDYQFSNIFDNKSYSFIGEILYSSSVLSGQWNIGVSSMYKNLNQHFNDKYIFAPYYWKNYLYTDFSKSIGKFGYTVGIGLDHNYIRTDDKRTYNRWLLRPIVSLSYKLKTNSYLRFSSSINPQMPEIGYLTDGKSSIDEFFYSKGNPDLKPSYTYKNDLTMQYALNDKLSITPSVSYNLFIKPYMPILTKEGDEIQKTYINIDMANEYVAGISANWNVLKYFTLKPYYQYSYMTYKTPNNDIRNHCHNAGISFMFAMKSIQAAYHLNLPFTTVNGDIYKLYGNNSSATIFWKYKQLSIGAEWIHSPNPSKIYGKINGFDFEEDVVWRNFNNMFNIRATYYFSIGKSKRARGKRLNNNDMDTGLIQENTAK